MGDASPAVSYDVDVVDEPESGPGSADAGGRGNDNFGFAAFVAIIEGAIGLKEGGGGRAKLASGGGEVA